MSISQLPLWSATGSNIGAVGGRDNRTGGTPKEWLWSIYTKTFQQNHFSCLYTGGYLILIRAGNHLIN